MKNTFFLLSLIVMLTGCAVTPNKRFPTFANDVQQIRTVDVVIDASVLADIDGDDLGVNKQVNEAALAKTKNAITQLFLQKGIKANVVFTSVGLFLKSDEETKIFFSNDFESTGEEFTKPLASDESSPWLSEQSKEFLTKLHSRGMVENKSNSKRKKKIKAAKVMPQDIPPFVTEMQSDLLAFIRIGGAEISMGKSVGVGIATGILTAILTGGAYIATSTPVSSSSVYLTLFDVKQSEVVWHNSVQLAGSANDSSAVESHVHSLMKPFPATNTGTATTVEATTAR